MEFEFDKLYRIPTKVVSRENPNGYTGNLYIVAKNEEEALRKWSNEAENIPGYTAHGVPEIVFQRVIV